MLQEVFAMEITKSILEKSALKLLDNELKVEDIPSIKQYADQVTELLNSKLHNRRKGDHTSIAISKAMINNYTKSGLLNPTDKKKYDKNHIILLSLIFHLKQVLSLDDIKTIFNPILKNLGASEVKESIISLDDIYKAFLEFQKEEYFDTCNDFEDRFNRVCQKINNPFENHSSKDMIEKFLTILLLVAEATAAKQLAEEMIDTYFKTTE